MNCLCLLISLCELILVLLPWRIALRVAQQITSDEDHDCSGALSNNSPQSVV